jgi:enamine deaminase RidA (YjgF/YER057c/UK114 family)
MPLEKHPTDPDKYIYKPREYKLSQTTDANTISFHSMNTGWVMRITADRRIEVAEGVDVTEAARLVLDAMQTMLDVGLEKAVLAEREECAKILDANAMACHTPIMRSLLQANAQAIRARGQA